MLFVNWELIHEGNWNCFWPPGSMKGQWLLLSLSSSQDANDGWQSYANGQDVWGIKRPYREWRGEPVILMIDKSHGKALIQIWVASKRQEQMKWISAALFRPVLQRRKCAPTPQFCTWVMDGWVHPAQWRHHLKVQQRQTSHAQWNWWATIPAFSTLGNQVLFWIPMVKCWQLSHILRLDSSVTSALENGS